VAVLHCAAQALLAKYGKRLFGVESRRPLNEFDVLGFSLSYELGGTNILEMLRQAGVPRTWKVPRRRGGCMSGSGVAVVPLAVSWVLLAPGGC
jgi:hypothetical protein